MEGISRRWVLQLGSGVVLAGFHGAEAADLPPGLYLPSLDHLSHRMHAASGRPLAEYKPRFFAGPEFALVQRIVGVMLGDTGGPPELVVDIANWIDLVVSESAEVRAAALAFSPAHRRLAIRYYGAAHVRELETSDPQKICRDGLRLMGSGDLSAALQAASVAGPEEPSRKFFDYMKRRVIEGYYTSAQGLRELDYKGNSFYSEPPGCAAS